MALGEEREPEQRRADKSGEDSRHAQPGQAIGDAEALTPMREVLMLQTMGWGPLQARAIADGMDGMPAWKDEWHHRMADHCSSHEVEGLKGQASFLTWTLLNPHQAVGNKLKAAETEEDAIAALKDFWLVVRL
jgi:hypothetical protein